MISPLFIERRGRWRIAVIALVALAVTLPAWPLVLPAFHGRPFAVDRTFLSAASVSLRIALGVALVALAIGWPLGVLTSLYAFPARRWVIPLIALPLLLPSFLWAIGWSALAVRVSQLAVIAGGSTGCVLVFLTVALPLVLLATYAACSTLSDSQLESARLAGGERAVVVYVCRYTAGLALTTATLAGVLTLSDPGPGMIFGVRTAASEILTSFSAQFDFEQGARQCLLLAGIVLLATAPIIVYSAPTLAHQILAKQTRRFAPHPHPAIGRAVAASHVVVGTLLFVLPFIGLALPALDRSQFARAGEVLGQTVVNTLVYAAGAGLVAVMLAILAASAAGRGEGLRQGLLAICVVLFALPPALFALGTVRWATASAAWADPLLRSRLTVCLELGLRLFPVAAILAMRAWGTIPASWSMAAAVHGLSLPRFLVRVVLPHVGPSLAVAIVVVGLLATADVSSVLLIHPPGEGTLPLAIFTIMANAPESLVASLCLVYLIASGAGLLLLWTLIGVRRP